MFYRRGAVLVAIGRGGFFGHRGRTLDVSDGNDGEKKQTRRRRHAKGIGQVASGRVKEGGR